MSQNTPRPTPRFIPRATIYRPAKAAKSALYFDWMPSQLRGAGLVRPGLVAGVLFTNLDNGGIAGGGEQDFDGFPGLPSKIRGAALTLDYAFTPIDTGASSYTRQPSRNENAERKLDYDYHSARLADIKTALAKPKITEAEKKPLTEEKNEVTYILDQLARGGDAYLTTGYQMLDTEASGIDWALYAENVPISLKGNFEMERDRAFGFSLRRDTPAEEQAIFDYVVGFGNGFTQYAISMGSDGNSSEFWHYRNMSAAARAKLMAQLETVLDFGRLTVADRAQLLKWENAERAIRAAAKAREEGMQKLTDAESAQIETLKKQAIDLKAAKHLTDEQDARKQDLENKIWLAREQFKLQEESADLIGKRVDVSVQFLQSGYIVVRSGGTQYVYENKRVTSLEPPQYHFALPEKSRLTIDSTGGAWGFVFARLDWNRAGDVLSQPFESWEPLSPLDFEGKISGALLANSQPQNGEAWNYGCSAAASLVELKAPTGTQPGRYQLSLHLVSDGRYTSEIYYTGLYRAASLVTGNGFALWDSEAPINRNNGASRVIDALLQDDKRRARLAKVVYADGRGAANLPAFPIGLAMDLEAEDRETGQIVTLLKHGFIAGQEQDRVGALETASGYGVVLLHGNETVLDVQGCEGFLNRQITALIPSDGEYPNDYVRMMCQDAEMPAFLWERIPVGAAGGFERIAPTRPGRYPTEKPNQGGTFLEQVNACVRNHCKDAQFWSDALGLLLNKFAARDRPELDFGTPATGAPVRSHLCLRNEWKQRQDVSDYVTSATVIGAKNPITGQRFSATVSIPQATDAAFEGSPYHIGYSLPYYGEADDSLRSDAACALKAREVLRKSAQTPDGLGPVWSDIIVDMDTSLLCGDLIRIAGVRFLVDSVDFSAFNSTSSGSDAGQLRVSVQIAENRTALP